MISQVAVLACAILSVQACGLGAYNGDLDYSLGGDYGLNYGVGSCGLNYGAGAYGLNYGADVATSYGGELSGIGAGLAAPVFVRPAQAVQPASFLLPQSAPVVAEAVQPASYILPSPAPSCAFIPTLGPRSPALPVIRTSDVVAPEASRVVDLPAPIAPPTRVISNTCRCAKKIVKDQVYEQVVRIPSSIRYIKKSYVPVEEKIRYCARGQVGQEAASRSCGGAVLPIPVARPACGCY